MQISEIQGHTFTKVTTDRSDYVRFYRNDGRCVTMHHHQDCCENVSITDINGDLDDLVDTEILVAEERTSEDSSNYESSTWTFYTLRTIKGSVDIRWLGTSNGYYSERVSIDVND